MENNYYEILEINENASQEIVKKAYQTLAKKYHPDLQEGDKKKECEEKLKLINEAYEVLVDPEKRKAYDATLEKNTVSAEDYENLYRQKEYMKQRIERMEQDEYYDSDPLRKENEFYRQQQEMERARRQAYHDAYVQDLRNRGYRIRYKKDWKDYLAVVITIIVVIVVFWILWLIPPIKEYFIELYNSNGIIKIIVDAVLSLFGAIFKRS